MSAFFHISSKRFGWTCSGEGSLRASKKLRFYCAAEKQKMWELARERKARVGWRHVEGGIRCCALSASCVGVRRPQIFHLMFRKLLGERVRPEISRKIYGKRLAEGWRKNRIRKFYEASVDFGESLATISNTSRKSITVDLENRPEISPSSENRMRRSMPMTPASN